MTTSNFRPWMVGPPLAVLLIWGAIGFFPARQISATAETRIRTAQEAQVRGAAQRNSLEQFRTSSAEMTTRVRSAKASVPASLEVAAFVRTLEQLAIDSALQLDVLAPSGVSGDSFVDGNDPLPAGLSAVSITIGATGSYNEITEFVRGLEEARRLVLVDSIAITTTDENLDVLGLDLTLRIFTTAELTKNSEFEDPRLEPIDESSDT